MNDRKADKSQPQMNTQQTHVKSDAKLGREATIRIGQQLRAMYDDVVNEGVPDRFADLLRRMEKADEPDKQTDDERPK